MTGRQATTRDSWWQVDTTKHGVVVCVWANKPTGPAAGLWTIEREINDVGRSVYKLVRSRHTDELSAEPVEEWHLSAEQGDDELVSSLVRFVGVRTARGMVKRLRPRSE